MKRKVVSSADNADNADNAEGVVKVEVPDEEVTDSVEDIGASDSVSSSAEELTDRVSSSSEEVPNEEASDIVEDIKVTDENGDIKETVYVDEILDEGSFENKVDLADILMAYVASLEDMDDSVKQVLGLTKKESLLVLNALGASILTDLNINGRVKIPHLGTFKAQEIAQKETVMHGEKQVTPATVNITFTPEKWAIQLLKNSMGIGDTLTQDEVEKGTE